VRRDCGNKIDKETKTLKMLKLQHHRPRQATRVTKLRSTPQVAACARQTASLVTSLGAALSFGHRRHSPQRERALAAGAVGFGGTGGLDAAADKGHEGVNVGGKQLRVSKRRIVARVDLNNACMEANQAERTAAEGQKTVRPCRDFAQQSAAWCSSAGRGGRDSGWRRSGSPGGKAAETNVAEDSRAFLQNLGQRLS
jgi:hypothetical protein